MNTVKRCVISHGFLAMVVAACFTGCIPDEALWSPLDRYLVSWSPDGRYLASVGSDEAVWLWDTRTSEAKRLTGESTKIEKKALFCKYLSSRAGILVGVGSVEDVTDLWQIHPASPDDPRRIATGVSPWCGVSQDGEYVYSIKKDGKRYQLFEHDLQGNKETEILTTELEIGPVAPVAPDATRSRIAISKGTSLLLLDRDNATSRVVFTQQDAIIAYPTWLDASRVAFQLISLQVDEVVARLMVCSVDDGTTRVLCDSALVFCPFSLSPNRESIAFTHVTGPGLDEENAQMAVVDIKSGEMKVLTDESLGAAFPVFSPDGNRIAYFGTALVRILDLETGKKAAVWRTEEERLFARLEHLAETGDERQLLMTRDEIKTRFPEGEFGDLAEYFVVRFYMEPSHGDPDKAFDALRKTGTVPSDLDWLEEKVLAFFWPEGSRLATDPPEDWIQTYGTAASQREFGFRTDLARDLRGLWITPSNEWLFIRIDYETDRDLTGLAFQDTLLLLDYDSPGAGLRRISNTTEWDRGAERQVLVRHWFPADGKSQYDVEIRDAGGEVVFRFLGSGYDPPRHPKIELDQIKETRSLLVVISRDILGLSKAQGDKAQRVGVQVCTFKGGIESNKQLERPRVEKIDGRTVCDVADAFGPENTRARIEADLKSNSDPAAPAIIKGCAGTFEVRAPLRPEN